MQAIILAGGFGSRLKTVVNEVPKPLAPISNKPFLYWLIIYLQQQGITNFIFSLGYLHQQVKDFLANNFSHLAYECFVEDEPLGTGGAIKFCIKNSTQKDILIVNGDTFFDLNIKDFYQFYQQTQSQCSIALTPMEDFDRYGSVEINAENVIVKFKEKTYCQNGFINTGLIFFNKEVFLDKTKSLPQNFSYEKDFLEPNIANLKVTGYITNGYFIDIGIPEDYFRANKEISLVIKS